MHKLSFYLILATQQPVWMKTYCSITNMEKHYYLLVYMLSVWIKKMTLRTTHLWMKIFRGDS